MPKPFKIKYATANCNNGGLGESTATTLLSCFNETTPSTDALVINCQEADFAKVKTQLEQAKKEGYVVTEIGHMTTFTKTINWNAAKFFSSVASAAKSLLTRNTGIATFVVHKAGLTIKMGEQVKPIRSERNFNKGGLVSRFTLSDSNKTATIDTISAHYESSGVIERSKDHLNVLKGHHQLIGLTEFNNFEDLAEALPDQVLYGADTNVRDRYNAGPPPTSTNMWDELNNPEIQSLIKLPLAPTQHTAENTYGKFSRKIEKEKEKRKDLFESPLAKKGKLDKNAHFGTSNFEAKNKDNEIKKNTSDNIIDIEEGEDRDHVVVISDCNIPISDNGNENNFKKTQQFICGRLQNFRPELAKKLSELENNDENSQHLLNIYNLYLTLPNGLIHIKMRNHQRYLEEIQIAVNQAKTQEQREKLKLKHLKITKELWAEPLENSQYQLLLNFNTLDEKDKKKYLKNFPEKKHYIDNISKNATSNNSLEKTKQQLGNYKKKPLTDEKKNRELARKNEALNNLIQKSHNDASKKALYMGVQHYKNKHLEEINKYNDRYKLSTIKSDNPNFFREALLNHLKEKELKYIHKSNRGYRSTSPGSVAITMADFLDNKGVELYKLALEEEANSKEYRDAVYFNSATLVDGPKWKQRPIHFIAGVSASGKTYTAQKILSKIRKLLTFEGGNENDYNLMLQPDGGIDREVSQIRKLMVKISTSHGFPGLSDLHQKSNILSSIKDHVRDAAFASTMKVGVTLPDTFSSWAKKPLVNRFSTAKNTIRNNKETFRIANALDEGTAKIFFTRIDGEEFKSVSDRIINYIPELPECLLNSTSFRMVVNFLGTKRSYKKSDFDSFQNYDLNDTDIVESKAYEWEGFFGGEIGSTEAEKWLKKKVKNATIMHATNDLQIVRTKECLSTYCYTNSWNKNAFLVSRQVIEAWESLIKEDTQSKKYFFNFLTPKKLNYNTNIDGKPDKKTSKNTLKNHTTQQLAAYYIDSIKKPAKPTLCGFNDFLIANNALPEMKITGTKDITLQLIQEEISNDHSNSIPENIKILINDLPINYTRSHLEKLKNEINKVNSKDNKAMNYYDKLDQASHLAHIKNEYSALHDHLTQSRKITHTSIQNNIIDVIENNTLEKITIENLMDLIKEDLECFFMLTIEKQIEIYKILQSDISSNKAILDKIKGHSFDDKQNHRNVDLLRTIIEYEPALFFDLPIDYQETVHQLLYQASTLGGNEIYMNEQNPLTIISEIAKKNLETPTTDKKYLAVQWRDAAASKLNAETIYQQYLVEKAIAQAMTKSDNNRFTIQGHVLVNITLDNNDYSEILRRIEPNGIVTSTAQATLNGIIGDITQTTQCSIDVIGNRFLEKQFELWLQDNTSTLSEVAQKTLTMAVDVLYASDSRASIISLQEEMEAHFNLLARISRQSIDSTLYSDDEWQKIKQQTLQLLSNDIREIIQAQLIENYQPKYNSLDYGNINKALDKTRPELSEKVKLRFLESMSALGQNHFSTAKEKLKSLNDEAFPHHTATGFDAFRTDQRNQTALRVTGTEITAHDKKLGKDHQARREFKRSHYYMHNGNPTIHALREHSIEIRVPSLAVLKNETGEFYTNEAIINDVKQKLDSNYKLLSDKQGGEQGIKFYNLLTSIDPIMDGVTGLSKGKTGENYQALSAELIIKGAHEFNRNNIKQNNENNLFLIQNIPVNQHGRHLTLDALTQPLLEVSLMSELSMLANLNSHQRYLPSKDRQLLTQCYDSIKEKYINFLKKNTDKNSTFSDSIEGIAAINILKQYKCCEGSKDKDLLAENKTLQHLASQALAIMHKNNMHENMQFGMTLQALSVFLEPASIAGCKSANERYAAVSGRVELLKSINNRLGNGCLSQRELLVYSEMKMLIEKSRHGSKNEIESACRKVQKVLDIAYNNHNLQSGANETSKEDQGMGAKVQKSSNKGQGHLSPFEIVTNTAESSYVNWLYQTKTGKLQAHRLKHQKAMLKAIEAFEQRPLTQSSSNKTKNYTPPEPKDQAYVVACQKISLLALKQEVKNFDQAKLKKAFCNYFEIQPKNFSWKLFNALLYDQGSELEVKLILNKCELDEIDFSEEEKSNQPFINAHNDEAEFKNKIQQQLNKLEADWSTTLAQVSTNPTLAITNKNNATSDTPPLSDEEDFEPPPINIEISKAMIKRIFGKDIIDSASGDIEIKELFNKNNSQLISNRLLQFTDKTIMHLRPQRAKQYLSDLHHLLAFIESELQKNRQDIGSLQEIINHSSLTGRPNTRTSIFQKITALKNDNLEFTHFRKQIEPLLDKFDKQTRVSSLNFNQIHTTYIKPQTLENFSASQYKAPDGVINSSAVTTLDKIPNGEIALHQITHIDKKTKHEVPLAFSESQDHKQLKAINFQQNTSKEAKMKLAMIMAQKVILNFDGKPSLTNKIYLDGKDPEFVEMLYGAFSLLSKDNAINFPMTAVEVLAYGIDLKANITDQITDLLDKKFINSMIEIAKEVQHYKSAENTDTKLDELEQQIDVFKNNSSAPGA